MQPVDFIKEKISSTHLAVACRQQKQLAYFTQSSVQDNVSLEYLKQYATRNYNGTDYFLNWIKQIFRTQNFMTFYKYLRFPLPSSKLINDEIKPQLKRVYYADDSFFKYVINGREVETPEELKFEEFENVIFNAMLFRHNDIIIHDLFDVNESYRELLSIEKVVAIDSHNGKIRKLSYYAKMVIDDEVVYGILYVDDKEFIFFDKDMTERSKTPHDLEECPAAWISNEAFYSDNDIVKKSLFSYVREELEEYVFLKTLLKMSEPNGAIPITVQLKTAVKPKDGHDINGISEKQPMTSNLLGSQHAEFGKDQTESDSILQTGTNVKIPMVKDNNGRVDTDLIQNFAKFFYIPVECLEYMNARIVQIERSIITNVLGDYSEMNDTAKNALQVTKSFVNKQDKLRSIALNLSWIHNRSDFQLLALSHGRAKVAVSVFYGSDFFLDDESVLYDMFNKCPNPIERRNILIRIAKTKFRFNKEKSERNKILYSLLPFTSDADFKLAIEQNLIDDILKKYQLQFNYWISMFEAEYGDITIFYNNFGASNSQKLIAINNLITDLIQTENEPAKKD